VKSILSSTSIERFGWRRFWLVLILLALAPSQALAWWQTDWSYRKQLTIDTTPKGANVAEAAGRVPVLIRLHTGNFSFGDAQDNGNDIRFVGSDDKTPLPFHVESFDPLLGVAAAWVDIPDFPAGSAKQIWLYYGNKKAPPAADIAGTFDADYTVVFHFDDGAGAPPKDKTAYGNNAQNAPAGIDDGAIVGKGARFAGTGPITVPASPSLAITPKGAFTFSAWIKQAAPRARQALYVRSDNGSTLVVGLDSGTPFAEVQGSSPVRVAAPRPIAKGQWTQVAVTADGKSIILYVNGANAAAAAGALPALNSVTAIGGAPQGATLAAPVSAFIGEMDELRLSKVARNAALIRADAIGEGPESRLVQFGVDEKQAGFGFGYFGIIVKSVTIDAWVVIGILGCMAVMSWFVMWTKASYVSGVDKANDAFVALFRRHGGDPFAIDESKMNPAERRRLARSSIWRVYHAASEEIRRRIARGGALVLNAEAIQVIRAVMDASQVRENQRLARSMVLLTISISGGPFLGLLGTVVGVMITFAAIAATGDVNVNAIAPGISAALLATVTGLAVAIPALFGYNYLIIRNKNVSADMQVFVDEFVTRLSESHSGREFARAAE